MVKPISGHQVNGLPLDWASNNKTQPVRPLSTDNKNQLYSASGNVLSVQFGNDQFTPAKKTYYDHFRNLVFEGGGVRGLAYAGALEELEKRKILDNIERVAGSSVGAIFATAVALGYTPQETKDTMSNINYKLFKDDGFIVGDIMRFFKSYGWYKGKVLTNTIEDIIKKKTGKKNLTFAQLEELRKKHPGKYRSLFVTGTNVTRQRAEIYSHMTTPDMQIAEAVRISAGTPYYFQVVRNKEGDVLVDGGVAWNYPINMFDHAKYLDNPDNGIRHKATDKQLTNLETLGFRLMSPTAIEEEDPTQPKYPKREIKNILNYSKAMLDFLTKSANSTHLKDKDFKRTIRINTLDISSTQFDLSPQQVDALVSEGRKGAKEYFDWRDKDDSIKKPK